jgi:hypothetical protein
MTDRINPYKVVVFGTGGVGKSSITIRFVTDKFSPEYLPTVSHLSPHNPQQSPFALFCFPPLNALHFLSVSFQLDRGLLPKNMPYRQYTSILGYFGHSRAGGFQVCDLYSMFNEHPMLLKLVHGLVTQ